MGLILLTACAEVVSLGAVLPFIAVLAAPDKVLQYAIVADLAQSWGINSGDQLVLPLTVVFCLAAIIAGAETRRERASQTAANAWSQDRTRTSRPPTGQTDK